MKTYVIKFVELRLLLVSAMTFCFLFGEALSADSLDEGVIEDSFLAKMTEALAAYNIDVSSNLNKRDVIALGIEKPRLGRFPDLPINSFPDSEEIANWEEEYLATEIGGLAIILDEAMLVKGTDEEFLERWLKSSAQQRVFVTFYAQELSVAESINSVVKAYGYATQFYYGGAAVPLVGNLYSTAAQRLAIDSRSARRYRTSVTELEYLGERVRRKTNSLFKSTGSRTDRALARREPSTFLKETLGDQFTQSTIREMIVPGGVALGETADIDVSAKELIYRNGELLIVDKNSRVWSLPVIEAADAKALFDFVERSEAVQSDAMVDIDEDGRVRISSALRNTNAGFVILHADTQPFEFVPNLPVTKSVVIDTEVSWEQGASTEQLVFASSYEVRFLSADNMRIAQTRVALEYEYQSALREMRYIDAWGRDKRRLDNNLDYAGLGGSMVDIARYAAWVGLFRRLDEEEVPFLQGRYEFMKIDKQGKNTPVKY